MFSLHFHNVCVFSLKIFVCVKGSHHIFGAALYSGLHGSIKVYAFFVFTTNLSKYS